MRIRRVEGAVQEQGIENTEAEEEANDFRSQILAKGEIKTRMLWDVPEEERTCFLGRWNYSFASSKHWSTDIGT